MTSMKHGVSEALSRYIRASGAIWLVVTCASLGFPLVQILGYESALLTNLLVVCVGGPRLLWPSKTSPPPIGPAFRQACLELGAWTLVSLGLVWLASLFVRNCDLGRGFGFWLMFGLLSVPWVAALSVVLQRTVARRWLRLLIYASLVFVSALSSGLWLAFQPPLAVYDLFHGYWAVSLYDEALRPWWSHAPYRLLTFLLSFAVLSSAAWPSDVRARWGAPLLWGLALLMLVFAGPLGIARSRGYVQEALGGYVETQHFHIYYEASAFSEPDLLRLVADHERMYDELAAFWKTEPSEKLRSFIYGSAETRATLMASRQTMIARIWLGEMHLVWRGYGDALLKHEMAHLFLREAGRGPLRVASANGLTPLMGLVEGAAGAAEWDFNQLDDHGWAAAILEMERVRDVHSTLSASGFWSQPSGVAYTLWSSLSRWLIDTYGVASFLKVYGTGDFSAAYGQNLHALIDAWMVFLSTQPLNEAQQAEAVMRFERPSLLRRACGRAIATMESDAGQALQRRDKEKAQRCISWLEEQEPDDLYLQRRVGRYWEQWGDVGRAKRVYERVLGHPGSDTALAQNLRLQLADVAWRQEDTETARTHLSALEAEPLTHDMQRNVWVRRHAIEEQEAFPRCYQASQRYLSEAWNYRGLDLRFDLLSAALEEKSPACTWLAYRVAATSYLGVAADILAQQLNASERVPPSVELQFSLDQLARWARLGESDKCRQYLHLESAEKAFGSAIAAHARVLRERCEVSGLYLDAARRAVE